MGLALLDSSAFVAYLVEGDTLHASAAEAIESAMSSGTALAVSAVTWAEVLHGALLGHFPGPEVYELAADFGIDVLPVDAEIAERAAVLQHAYRDTAKRAPRPKLRTPDALILATADVSTDVDVVIAGDGKWAKVPGLRAQVVLLQERPR